MLISFLLHSQNFELSIRLFSISYINLKSISGFSNQIIDLLHGVDADFSSFDVLEDDEVRFFIKL